MEENILVSVRARPLNERERGAGEYCEVSWLMDPVTRLLTSIPDPNAHLASEEEASPFSKSDRSTRVHEYSFDHIFEPHATTQDVYSNVAQGIVWSAMEGFNGTIFAYGQTGSGKTFTMKGVGRKQPGILNLAIHDVWAYIQQHPEREFLLRVSYMEIYNEIVNDLLTPGNTNLKIHEDPVKGVYVGNLKEEIVVSPTHVMALLAGGDVHRHVGATNYNEQSSRSHTLFRIVIESKEVGSNLFSPEPQRQPTTPGRKLESTSSPVRASSLTLIDLAGESKKLLGSERSSAGASEVRQREGSHINQSLLTLGIIVAKLADKKVGGHIPWRDSKLTRILQPSLGGNARVAIISTITLANGNLEETVSTLKFATRAKRVKNSAKVNELVEEKGLLRHYRSEIANLKMELAKALANEKTLIREVPHGESKQQEEKKKMEMDNEAMIKKMAELEQNRVSLESKVSLSSLPSSRFFLLYFSSFSSPPILLISLCDVHHISSITKLILRGGFANNHSEEDDETHEEPHSNGHGTPNHHTPHKHQNGTSNVEPTTPVTSRVKSTANGTSPSTRVSQLNALIDQLHNELKQKDEIHTQLRQQIEGHQTSLLKAKQQIVRLQEEAIQRAKGDEWLILQQALKEERTRASIYASADAEYRTQLGHHQAARACLELDVKVVEKERALLSAHARAKDLRIAELEVEVHELRTSLEREARKRMYIGGAGASPH